MGKQPATVITHNGKGGGTLRSATRLYNDHDNLFKRFKGQKKAIFESRKQLFVLQVCDCSPTAAK